MITADLETSVVVAAASKAALVVAVHLHHPGLRR